MGQFRRLGGYNLNYKELRYQRSGLMSSWEGLGEGSVEDSTHDVTMKDRQVLNNN